MRRLVAALGLLVLAGGALAQPAPAQPDVLPMARTALGAESGSASVALWRDGKLLQATVRRESDKQAAVVALASNAQAPVGRVASDWWAQRYPVSDQAIPIAAQQLEPYVGVYQVNPELSFSVVAYAGSLYVRSTNGVFRAYIAVAPDRFTRPAGGARIVFARDGARVTGMTLEQSGARLVAVRSAQSAPVDGVLAPGKTKDYVGRFAVPNQAGAIEFDVRDDDGQLSIRSTRFPWAPVLPVAGKLDRFRYDIPDAEVQFERAADGAVQAMVLHQRGEMRAIRQADAP